MYLLNVAFSFFTPHIFFRNVLKKKKKNSYILFLKQNYNALYDFVEGPRPKTPVFFFTPLLVCFEQTRNSKFLGSKCERGFTLPMKVIRKETIPIYEYMA